MVLYKLDNEGIISLCKRKLMIPLLQSLFQITQKSKLVPFNQLLDSQVYQDPYLNKFIMGEKLLN